MYIPILILIFLSFEGNAHTGPNAKHSKSMIEACRLEPSLSFCHDFSGEVFTTRKSTTVDRATYCSENANRYHFYCAQNAENSDYCQAYFQKCTPTTTMPTFPTIPVTTKTTPKVHHVPGTMCEDSAEQYYYYCTDKARLQTRPMFRGLCEIYEKECAPTPQLPAITFPPIPTTATTTFDFGRYCKKYEMEYYYFCMDIGLADAAVQENLRKYCPSYERYCKPSAPPTIPTIPPSAATPAAQPQPQQQNSGGFLDDIGIRIPLFGDAIQIRLPGAKRK